mmetsp:Transcript_73228/g.89876  ORF Transcript_73228/g.89876 Transcript_73228/m.89876 type:complete len:122 (-) Transcript_73228:27-392(-)|eukprot:CAMPEP_0114666542 /NCGR_PEP_ID=MMETSP0191-20121206/32740_1 /TAXON_ID=126664 /ORGANISM="Sorites sp." /LENGTH=121 /DNA_ID=CAMNT_0001914445 /DNA_START=40 /DNA_END=405 /DNA_ORIENTATION=+
MSLLKVSLWLLFGARQCLTWDEPMDSFLEDALLADLAAEDRAADAGALHLLQATAKLHHRGPQNDLPDLGRGGGSLAAAIDGALESEVPTVSFVQSSAEHRGRVHRSQSSRKAMLKAQQEL